MRDIVCPRENHHDLRLQLDDVRAETHQHLRRDLSADAAAYISVLGEEIGVDVTPILGDGVAHEDDFDRFLDRLVLGGILTKVCPVFKLLGGEAGRAHQAEGGENEKSFFNDYLDWK